MTMTNRQEVNIFKFNFERVGIQWTDVFVVVKNLHLNLNLNLGVQENALSKVLKGNKFKPQHIFQILVG